jgi:2-keto-4-pentenoate hydratase
MKIDLENLVDRIADRVAGRAPWKDIMEDEPGLAEAEAYSVQAGLMRRRIAEGETVIGYKAAYTSAAIQAQRGNGGPIVGAILRSAHLPESAPIAIVPNSRNAVEPEVAVLLGADLSGPGVTPLDVLRATKALLPAIEVAVGAPGNVDRSRHMVIATHKTAGSIIVGGPGLSPAGIDLRVEGCVMSINGKVRGSATGVEVMGDPYNAAAFIANTVLANGDMLRAGMILMTGSIIAAIPIAAGDDVRVDFTRLGSVGIRFAA